MSRTQNTGITAEQRERAAKTLHDLPFAKLMGMRLVALQIDLAVIKIDMRDDLRHPGGILHGGVTATLIDTAMAYAVRTRVAPDERTATIDLTVHYLRPHIDGTFICTAKVVRAGKRIFTVSADVHNENGDLIATAISTHTRI
ncbi:MAG: PaaI family thioesterase [Acidobacteria bacterium]|nr:PaaI family thioesterase [Acidobacteriota bacterium]